MDLWMQYRGRGLITLPASILADLICLWRIQVSMAFSIAYVYGHTKDTTDLKTDLYLILAGDSAKEAVKKLHPRGVIFFLKVKVYWKFRNEVFGIKMQCSKYIIEKRYKWL